MLILDTSLVDLDTLDCDDALLRCQEPCIGGRVGEEEPGDGFFSDVHEMSAVATYQNSTETINVMRPKMIMSLICTHQLSVEAAMRIRHTIARP